MPPAKLPRKAQQESQRRVLSERKTSHLDLCEHEQVEYRGKTTLFEEVELIHNSLPELALADIDVGVDFLGKRLRAPLLITGMTGGTDDSFAVNRDLAIVAERCGIGFGLGSQRVMQRDPSTQWTFAVRQFAPSVLLFANIGLTQASDTDTEATRELVESTGADVLCVHLNPAQELIQPEGDRSFRNGYATLARLSGELDVPVVAKETGCGLSPQVVQGLRAAGIGHADISGAGGTSWVRVETLRGHGVSRRLGETFSNWGIPTAASLAMLRGCSIDLIASGGIRNGLEMAKAFALGARLCGVALPIFRAYRESGIDGALAYVDELVSGLKTAMLLTGSRSLGELSKQPLVLGPQLRTWMTAGAVRPTTE
ncbi:MAG: type 2 isopentenyl-diphosphate Delta-isomerase [Deltaproteobacteria bacterium]|nr:type 2 isopentenyl-diphosphate Delta-isomerase [Deltaproteobacteria bacterium]